jgi:membrane-bound lytic murein transglycosylase B
MTEEQPTDAALIEALAQQEQLFEQLLADAHAQVAAIKAEAEPRRALLLAEFEQLKLAGDPRYVALGKQIIELCKQTIQRIEAAYQVPINATAEARAILQKRLAEY